MSTPWEVLGVDPDTADRDSIRRAYVSLIKRHRPDRQPERFQEIRGAYELALSLLAFAEGAGLSLSDLEIHADDGLTPIGIQEPIDEGGSPDPTHAPMEAEPNPEAAEDAPASAYETAPNAAPDRLSERLESALRGGDDTEAAHILRDARRRFGASPTSNPWFYELAASAPEVYVRAFGNEVTAEDAVEAACTHGFEFTAAVLSIWLRTGSWKPLTLLADLVLERGRQGDPAGSNLPLAMALCAAALALTDEARARRLVAEAHHLLAPAWRDRALHEADVRLRISAELEDLPVEDRRQLAAALAMENEELSGPLFLAVRNAMHAVPEESVTYAVLSDRYPDTGRHVLGTQHLAASSAQAAGRRGLWSHAWVVVLVLGAAGLFTRALHRQLREHRRWEGIPAGSPEFPERFDGDHLVEILRGQGESRDGATRNELEQILLEVRYLSAPWLEDVRAKLLEDYVRRPDAADALLRGEHTIRRGNAKHRLMLQTFRDDPDLPQSVRDRCTEILRELGPPR